MRKTQNLLCGAVVAATAIIASSASPALATPIPPPPVATGQEDGLFITNGSTIVLYVQLKEGNEAFFGETVEQAPANFTAATLYLTQADAATCTPNPAAFSLGDCSDGLTLSKDPVTKQIDAAFVSNGATSAELHEFFSNVSGNTSVMTENGDWQDMSSLFAQAAGFAFVQSDADVGGEGKGTPFPEPISVSIVGAGLLGLWAVLRRKAIR